MIILTETTRDELAKTFQFAMENKERFNDFVRVLNYVRTYANNGDSDLTRVHLYPDHTVGLHGYIAIVERKNYDMDKQEIVWERVIVMGIVYHKDQDCWGTHS